MSVVVVALDIDSTVMTHGYPDLGEDIGAIPWLTQVRDLDPDRVKFIICSMRAGESAEVAKDWLEERGIPIWAINEHPTQKRWTDSPKPYFHVLCDDRAVGTPLDAEGNIIWSAYGPQVVKLVQRHLVW